MSTTPTYDLLIRGGTVIDGTRVREVREQTETPSPYAIPSGCRFHTRCPLAEPICLEQDPPDFPIDSPAGGHLSACHVLPKQ